MLHRKSFRAYPDRERLVLSLCVLFIVTLSSTAAQDPDVPHLIKASSPFPSPYPISSGSGLAYESCTENNDCVAKRKCTFIGPDNTLSPCGDRLSCVCLSPALPICLRNTDCIQGEVCANTQIARLPICISERIEQSTSTIDAVEISDSQGFTLEPCRPECQGTRICTLLRPDQTLGPCPGNSDDVCACMPIELTACSSSSECESAELCASTPFFESNLCVSREAERAYKGINELIPVPTPSPSPSRDPDGVPVVLAPPVEGDSEAPTSDISEEDEPTVSPLDADEEPQDQLEVVCVDARALQHVDKKDLVFVEHIWSRVLCDSKGSCATGGHMVIYHGSRMMMKSYCRMVSCVQRVIQVNSPKHKRALRVKSNTEGLEFTAFAARYGSRVEEMALAAAIRVGL